jgi:hypothetical protein
MDQKERLFYLDWVRIIVILLLVPFHSAVTFTVHGDGFIKYPQHVRSLEYFLWFLSIWIMPALFLVSGIAAYHALQFRTAAEYARERRSKLLLPLLAGLLLVCPPMAYLRALYMGTFQGSFLRFYPHFFSEGPYPQGNFNWGHFWFLAYLFVFTLIMRPLFARARREGLRQGLVKASLVLERGPSIYVVAIPLMLTETILRPHFPGLQNLVWDWANFVLYLVLVFYGFVFAVNNGILDNIYRIRLFSLCFGIVLFAVAVAWRVSGVARSMAPVFPAYNVLMVFAWVFALMGYARQWLNRKSGLHTYLNTASFPAYVFHFLPITATAYLIAHSDVSPWLKYALTVLLAYPLTFAIYECVRRVPVLRSLFAIRAGRRGV